MSHVYAIKMVISSPADERREAIAVFSIICLNGSLHDDVTVIFSLLYDTFETKLMGKSHFYHRVIR